MYPSRLSSGVLAGTLAFCTLLAVPAPAQSAVSGQLRTFGPYGVLAEDASGRSFRSIAPNTQLPATQGSLDAFAGNASASTLIGWRVRGDVLSCDVSEQGTGSGRVLAGTSSSPANSSAPVLGPHWLELTITGAPGLRGRLQVWASGVAQTGSTVLLGADIDADTVLDARLLLHSGNQGYQSRQWDVRLDATGQRVVRILTDARLSLTSGHAVYKTGISVVFTPGRYCEILDYGAACGAQLTGRDSISGNTRELSLLVNDGPVSAPGLLVIGTQQLALPIPGTSCSLHTDPLLLVPFATDAYGRGEWKAQLPASAVFVLRAQHVQLLPGPALGTSNGLDIRCL